MTSIQDIILAFLGGMLTFIRPCIYLIVITFLSFTLAVALTRSTEKLTGILKAVVPLYIGLTITFIICAYPSSLQRFFMDPRYRPSILKIVAVMVIGFGLAFLSSQKRPKFINEKAGNLLSGIGFFILGLALGIAWTHCLTPILGQILTPVSVNPKLGVVTLMLLIVYSAGLAVPFLASSLIVQKLVNTFKLDQNSGLKTLNASFFVLIGAALFTNSLWMTITRILYKASPGSLSTQLEVLLMQFFKS